MFPLSLDTPGASFYTLPLLYCTILLPHVQKGGIVKNYIGTYPNCKPRQSIELCLKKEIPPAVVEKLKRMEAAHINGFEGFPLWAAAIICANVAGVDARTINIASIALVGARLLYNQLYIGNSKSRAIAGLRSLTWLSTLITCFTLFVKAGNSWAAKH